MEAAAAVAAPAEEQQFIEVWRPGRSPDERRPPRHARPPRRHRGQAPVAQPSVTPVEGVAAPPADASASADTIAAPAAEAPAPHEQRGPRHHRGKDRNKDRNQGRRPDQRGDRQNRDRGGERPRQDDKPKGPPPRERREKVADPNSPFAKLAALKAQLEANAKERR